MTDTLAALLLRLSEGGGPAMLWGRMAKPHYGPAFGRMLAAGVLVECPPVEEWAACADCDCGFDARPIQRLGDRIIAACPFDASSDIELEEDDLRDFRIDAEKLVALIAEASGFRGTDRDARARSLADRPARVRTVGRGRGSRPGCSTSPGSCCC